jgi:hypothetical protein
MTASGAVLRLGPKQISTGDRTILGKISRRVNRYLARSVRAGGLGLFRSTLTLRFRFTETVPPNQS